MVSLFVRSTSLSWALIAVQHGVLSCENASLVCVQTACEDRNDNFKIDTAYHSRKTVKTSNNCNSSNGVRRT